MSSTAPATSSASTTCTARRRTRPTRPSLSARRPGPGDDRAADRQHPGATSLDAQLQPVPVGVVGEIYLGGRRPGPGLPATGTSYRGALRHGPVRCARPSARTAPATSRVPARRRCSNTSAEPTTRSRCAASASSWARSKRRSHGQPDVDEASSSSRGRTHPATKRLVAYVVDAVTRPRHLVDALTSPAAQQPAGYMVPAHFVALGEPSPHPQRQGGPQGASRARSRGGRAPGRTSRSAHARRRSASRRSGPKRSASPAPGVDDNFFDIGGHSLKAAADRHGDTLGLRCGSGHAPPVRAAHGRRVWPRSSTCLASAAGAGGRGERPGRGRDLT